MCDKCLGVVVSKEVIERQPAEQVNITGSLDSGLVYVTCMTHDNLLGKRSKSFKHLEENSFREEVADAAERHEHYNVFLSLHQCK